MAHLLQLSFGCLTIYIRSGNPTCVSKTSDHERFSNSTVGLYIIITLID